MPPEDDDKSKGSGDGAGGDGGSGGGGGNAGGEDTSALRKALASERAKAKAAEQERDQLKASIAEGKTDAERVAGTLAELKARADAADLRAMRAEVAASKGLTTAQARRLQGSTVEELEADADELVAAFKPVDDAGGAPPADDGRRRGGTARPTENLRPGATPPAAQDDTAFDSKAFLAAVPRG